MATAVTLTIPGAAPTSRVQAELSLLGNSGTQSYTLPITDPAAVYANLEANWVEVDVPGQKPYNVRAGGKLRTIQINVTLVGSDGGPTDGDNQVEPLIKNLMTLIANDGIAGPVAFTWGTFDSSSFLTQTGHWHVDAMTINSTWRQPGTNNISQATATITLKEVNDPPSSTGVQPGWTAPPAAPPAIPNPTGAGTITVAAADTAYSIAAAVYGDPEPGWRNILAYNGITDPRSLTAGQILVVPPNG